MDLMPILFAVAMFGTLALLVFGLVGGNSGKAGSRRLEAIKMRHPASGQAVVEAQMRRILAQRDTKLDSSVPQPLVRSRRYS